MYFLHIIHSIHVIVCCLRFWQSIDSEGRKKWGSRFDHLNIPQYPSLHPFLCVCVCFHLPWCLFCCIDPKHVAGIGSISLDLFWKRGIQWGLLALRLIGRCWPWEVVVWDTWNHGVLRWNQLLLPLSLGIWFPFDWCVSNGLKTPTRTSYGGVLFNFVLDTQKVSQQSFVGTDQLLSNMPTFRSIFYMQLQSQRHISITTPFFWVCGSLWKRWHFQTSPVVVDQPRESWNVSTQGQVRSVASTLDVPEIFEGSKPEKKPEICHISTLYIYIYKHIFYKSEKLLNTILVT